MSIKIHQDVEQGSQEWLDLRCGLLTASEVKLILTPTLKTASNDKERAHLYELASQRITKFVEPGFQSFKMARGHEDELDARAYYSQQIAPVEEVAFITNDEFGFTLGYSPDGLVGADGAIEAKSRDPKFQVEVIINGAPDPDHVIQLQTGMLVGRLNWIDYLSISCGMLMPVIRVYPDEKIQDAIVNAAGEFEKRLAEKIAAYHDAIKKPGARFIETVRRIEDIQA